MWDGDHYNGTTSSRCFFELLNEWCLDVTLNVVGIIHDQGLLVGPDLLKQIDSAYCIKLQRRLRLLRAPYFPIEARFTLQNETETTLSRAADFARLTLRSRRRASCRHFQLRSDTLPEHSFAIDAPACNEKHGANAYHAFTEHGLTGL